MRVNDTDFLRIIGAAYRKHREALGLSRADVERETRISQKAIEKFEAGLHAPNFMRFNRLLLAVNTSVSEMLPFVIPDDGLGENP